MNNLVIYVRHAESEANTIIHKSKSLGKPLTSSQELKIHSYSDPDITHLGIEQSKATAQYLFDNIKKMNKKHVTVWLSPMKRAQHTGKYFIDLFKDDLITTKIINELQEFTSTKITLEDHHTYLVNHATKEEFFDQIMKFNELLLDELKNQTHEPNDHILIIFGHSLFFSSILSYHIQHEKNKIVEFSSLQLPNCSISCESYNFTENKWKTYMVSNISHLPKNIVTGSHVL